MMKLLTVVIVAICSVVSGVTAEDNVFVCYFPNWAQGRPGQGQFTVNHINPNLCTHYLYSFALLHQDTFDLIVEDKAENIAQFAVGLKAKNPNLKTLIAIGGYADSNDGTGKYSNMVSTAANIDTFIGHVVDFVERYRFDGVDLDWEYPSSPEDKVGFSNLLTAMRRVFDTKGYLLTAAVPAGPYYTEPGYDVPVLDRTLDFINLMTYDMHGAGWEPSTADHHAPLYKRPWEADGNNVNFCVNYWISKGASPSKIVMGIPLYGQSWTILATSSNAPPAPANGSGIAGPYTQSRGVFSYYEICNNIKNNGWRVVQDPLGQMGPYAFTRLNLPWVGYDDPAFATVKSDYIIAKGLGGAMVWDVSLDDFANVCGDGANPIQTAIARVMGIVQPVTTTTTTMPTTTPIQVTPVPTTTSTQSSPNVCSWCVCPSPNGLFANPASCSSFYSCISGVVYLMECPPDLHFNPTINNCDWPYNVNCTTSVIRPPFN